MTVSAGKLKIICCGTIVCAKVDSAFILMSLVNWLPIPARI